LKLYTTIIEEFPMCTIAQLSEELQMIMTEVAYKIGQTSGFIQRERILNGSTFVQALTFGWLANPQASLGELNQSAANVGIEISPQGLNERFTPQAASCLRQVLAASLGLTLSSRERAALPVLARFSGVYVTDSSVVGLPKELIEVWPGCGGTHGATAALKLQVRWELLGGQLIDIVLRPGKEHDRRGAEYLTPLPAGSLQLEDLGYFKLDALQNSDQAGVTWVMRFKTGTGVLTTSGEPLDIVAYLADMTDDTLDLAVLLGCHHHIASRLIARRLAPAKAEERRRDLKRAAQKRGQTLSAARLALADWDLYMTNASPDLLSTTEVMVVMRVRWQIELLFKLWKSQGGLSTSVSRNPWRILCEVYAKLLGLVIQHWLILTTDWAFPARSLHKAAQTIRKHAFHLACVLSDREWLSHAIATISRCLSAGCRLNSRRRHPGTAQLLLECA
jgi:hypothetical protein